MVWTGSDLTSFFFFISCFPSLFPPPRVVMVTAAGHFRTRSLAGKASAGARSDAVALGGSTET